MIPYRRDLKQKARNPRKNMTDAEQRLWQHLRGKQLHGVQFYRQKPLGRYIVDFYAPAAHLAIELDGSQHNEPNGRRYDAARERWLSEQGIRVLRFDDRQALTETEAVLSAIEGALESRMGGVVASGRAFLHIAVGVIQDASGRVLIAQRRPGTPGAGKWEFPGGKRESNEDIEAALARELHEELDLTLHAARPLIRFSHDYADRTVLLDIWLVTDWSGEVHGREGQRIAWAAPGRLLDYDMLEANTPVVHAIQLPSRYAITPEPNGDLDAFLADAERVVAGGIRLIRLRAPTLGDHDYERVASALLARIGDSGCELLLDRDAAMCRRLGAAGLHWPEASLHTLSERPLSSEHWFAVSCHDRAGLHRAASIGADFATLSPVAHTASHPDATAMGWAAFKHMSEGVALPVYALGGVGEADLDDAWRAGAQGVAAVRAYWPTRGNP